VRDGREPSGYRLSVSTCAAKVRASLLKARSALSCCGILTDREIFDSAKTETGRPQNFKILKDEKRICID
jgi:hypothetical protein